MSIVARNRNNSTNGEWDMKYAVIDIDDEPAIVEVLMETDRWSLCCEVAEDGNLFDAVIVPFKAVDLVARFDDLSKAVALTERLVEINDCLSDGGESERTYDQLSEALGEVDDEIDASDKASAALMERRNAIVDQITAATKLLRDRLRSEEIAAATQRRAAA